MDHPASQNVIVHSIFSQSPLSHFVLLINLPRLFDKLHYSDIYSLLALVWCQGVEKRNKAQTLLMNADEWGKILGVI